jgi:hypothetical protein
MRFAATGFFALSWLKKSRGEAATLLVQRRWFARAAPVPRAEASFQSGCRFYSRVVSGRNARRSNDPEILDDLFFRFRVDATGTIDDIAARNDEWHARVCRLPVRFSGMFRLSIAVFKRRSV